MLYSSILILFSLGLLIYLISLILHFLWISPSISLTKQIFRFLQGYHVILHRTQHFSTIKERVVGCYKFLDINNYHQWFLILHFQKYSFMLLSLNWSLVPATMIMQNLEWTLFVVFFSHLGHRLQFSHYSSVPKMAL